MDRHEFISNRNGEACLRDGCGKPPKDHDHWQGQNPYYLLLKLDPDGGPKVDPPWSVVVVDLDRPNWLETLKAELESPGEWHLVRKKDAGVVFSLRVNEGDQPYYTARVIGVVGGGGGAQTRAYSIGKKTKRMRKGSWHDNEDNLWVLSWGQICGGADVEYFARDGLERGLR